MSESDAKRQLRIYDEEKSARSSLTEYFQELTYYSLPRKAYINRIKNIGDKYPTDIYDSTAILSNNYFAAGMQAYMSSAQTRWFTLGVSDRALRGSKSVQTYLKDCEDVLYSIINSSNFYQEDVDGYLSLGSIGTDVLYGEDDIKDKVRFSTINIEDVIIIQDATGRVTSAYLEYEFTADKAVEKFGQNNVGEEVLKAYKQSNFTSKWKYLYVVAPRMIFNPTKKDSKNMPWRADWVDRKREQVVKEGGYKEFPFMVSRFVKSKGSPYGDSIMMNILPDVKMINQLEYNNILGIQMSVRPPLEVPDEAFLKPYNFNPGGKNIKNAGYPNEHIMPINAGVNPRIGVEFVERKQVGIQQAFYNDLFLSVQRAGDMTATEFQGRNNQRMQLLGSAIGNIMREKLSPVVNRVYAIAGRANMLPPLPPELQGKNYTIEYISPLARAQKSLEMGNLAQAMQLFGQFADIQLASGEINTVIDKIDFDQAADYVGDITNLAPRIMKDDADVDAQRENRAEGMAQQQEMAQIQQGAEAVKTGADADKALAQAEAA